MRRELNAETQRTPRGSRKSCRGTAKKNKKRGKTEAKCARAQEIGADDAGSGAAEPAGGTADARVPGESGAGEAGDPGLGGDFAAAGLLLAGKIGARGDDSRFGIGRACGR